MLAWLYLQLMMAQYWVVRKRHKICNEKTMKSQTNYVHIELNP